MSYHVEFTAKNKNQAIKYLKSESVLLPAPVKAFMVAAVKATPEKTPIFVKASGHFANTEFAYDTQSWGDFKVQAIAFVEFPKEEKKSKAPADATETEEADAEEAGAA